MDKIILFKNELQYITDFVTKYVAFFVLTRLLVMFFVTRKRQFTTMDGVAERLSKLKLDSQPEEQEVDSDCELTSDVDSASDDEGVSSDYNSDSSVSGQNKKCECYGERQ